MAYQPSGSFINDATQLIDQIGVSRPGPIPYGFGGVIPNAMGGTPNLGGINANLAGMYNGGGHSMGSLMEQLGLGGRGGSAGALDMAGLGSLGNGFQGAPAAMNGVRGFGQIPGLTEFTSGIPAGAASRFPISSVPVSIRGAAADLAPGILPEAAGLGEAAAGGAGFLSRLKPVLPWAEGAGLKGIAAKSVMPLVASVALNKAGGMAGGNDTFMGRFLKGAGTGATAGIFGPEAGVVGALGMGLFAGLTGKKKDGTPVWLEEDVLNRAGFDDTDKAQIKMTYDILKETQGKDKANAAIGQLIMQDITNRQAQKQQDESSQKRMLSTQALAAQYFQPFTKQMMDSANNRYAITESMAKDLPPEFRAVARTNNIAALDNATKVSSAYATQAQLIPQMATVDYQKSMADQLAQQQAASVIQGMYGGGAGGAQSGSGLAAQLALQNQGQG